MSTAGLVVGVAAATTARPVILAAGVAGLVAGAVSMALGEYVSVSAQRDTQSALLQKEQQELDDMPELELEELTMLYAAKGLTPQTARLVAEELTEHAFAAHVDVELGIDPADLSNPWQAALSSAIAFTPGRGRPAHRDPVAAGRHSPPRCIPRCACGACGNWSTQCDAGRRAQDARDSAHPARWGYTMLVTYGIGQVVGTAL